MKKTGQPERAVGDIQCHADKLRQVHQEFSDTGAFCRSGE